MSREHIVATAIFMCLIITPFGSPYATESGIAMNNKRGIYQYSKKDLMKYLEKKGYKEFPVYLSGSTQRNADGSGIIFNDQKKNIILVADCDGNVFERLPYQVQNTGPNGKFFAEYSRKFCLSIYSFEKPYIAIYTLENFTTTRPLSVFYKAPKVYIFGNEYKEKRIGPLKGFVLSENNGRLEKIDEIEIPRPRKAISPYTVLDISPWGEDVLLLDVYDKPFRSKLFSFNMTTKKLKEEGVAEFFQGYLQCDIIKR
jgi:hypothetical protein